MVNQVIKLTGSSNHNKCAKADVKDPKAWCYTTDSNKRWEHCSPLCTGPDDPNNSDDPDNSDDSVVGTRFRDIPEQAPHMDPRSKYDQNEVKRYLSSAFVKTFSARRRVLRRDKLRLFFRES